MNRLVLPSNSSRSSLIPLVNSFSRDTQVRKSLSEAEKAEAEESFKVFCKPVEIYNALQRKAEKKALFLRRSLQYKLQAKDKRRIQVSISVRGAISDGLRTPNLFPLYIVFARPFSTPDGERPTSYRFKKACKLTTFIEGQTVGTAQATFILPEISILSKKVESNSIDMLLISCADINNSEEIDLTEPHTFSPSYEGCCLYGKIPIDFLQSSISPNLSLGEKVEVLSTVTMQSCYMKARRSDQDKCLSFHFPHSSEALSISQQVPVTITAEERGVMRIRARNVIFFYRYYNNMLQKSEVMEDYRCPFCLSKCGSYNGLQSHLTASHDLLRYEFLVDEDYQIVIVYTRDDLNIDEVFDRQVDGKQLAFQFCHRPVRRQNVNENHVGPLVMNSEMPTIPVGIRADLDKTFATMSGNNHLINDETIHEELKRKDNNHNLQLCSFIIEFFYMKNAFGIIISRDERHISFFKSKTIKNYLKTHTEVTLGESELLDYDVDHLNASHLSNAAAITFVAPESTDLYLKNSSHLILLYSLQKQETYRSKNPLVENNLNTTKVSSAAAITSVSQESTDLSVPTTSRTLMPSAKTRNLLIEQSAIRKKMLLYERQFYHSQTAQPMAWEQVNAEDDSEDEVDDGVADIEDRMLLEDFIDVNQHEKRLMHLWNSFTRRQRVLCDSHLPWTCAVFSDLHGSELVQTPQLRSCWNEFIVKLLKRGLIDVKTIENSAKIVDKYCHQIPNQVMRIAEEPSLMA